MTASSLEVNKMNLVQFVPKSKGLSFGDIANNSYAVQHRSTKTNIPSVFNCNKLMRT